MSFVTINDKEYKIPDVNFDAICELEENGVQITGAGKSGNVKMFSFIRGITAWIMGTDIHTASIELEEHIKNGGDATEVLSAFMQEAEKSGFFGNRKKQQNSGQKVASYQGNRNRRRGNGDHTRR